MGFFDSKPSKQAAQANPTPTPRPVTKPAPVPVGGSGQTTKVSPGFIFDGKATSEDDLVVDGQMKGEIHCKKHLLIGPKGVVTAKVFCHSITVQGELRGNVEAESTVTIDATGRLIGDISTSIFVNQPGGFFEGHAKMLPESRKNFSKGSDESKEAPAKK